MDGYYNKVETNLILSDGYYSKQEVNSLLDGYASGTNYYSTFTNSDITAGKITIIHSLQNKYVQTEIYDGYDQKIIPNEVTLLTDNSLEVDLTTFTPLYGIYSNRWLYKFIL